MIAYDLTCANGHSFEGWFEDLKAFEYQKSKKLIACPVCDDTSVVVVPSTFGIKSNLPAPRKPQEAAQPNNDNSELNPEKIMNFLDKNFEDVGHNFAKEALKMHYDVSEKRNIRGTSSPTEEETLKKEGIKFFKFPIPQADS
ncbi:MAG: DUF1178 family protein [Deltaproteobacteria bacterium]|nr:DUF1178 family protein [Deltaproteobacteria bacterium]